MFYFLDIASVVGFYAVSIPFMNTKSPLASFSQNERFRVSIVLNNIIVQWFKYNII